MANDMAAFTGEDEEIGEMVVFDIETTGLDKRKMRSLRLALFAGKMGKQSRHSKALQSRWQSFRPKS